MKKERRPASPLRAILTPALLLLVLLFFLSALSDLDRGQSSEELRQLEQSLRRAAVACYAAEGVYPPDLAYLEEHYGLQLDSRRYTVRYEIFGSNLMPSITVLEKDS